MLKDSDDEDEKYDEDYYLNNYLDKRGEEGAGGAGHRISPVV